MVVEVKDRPEIMLNARTDLGATVEGEFSPEDWEKILYQSEQRWRGLLVGGGRDDLNAWQEVIRDFHREHFWGFSPNYRPPKKPVNLGLKFVWMTFNTLTIMKVSILWFGQIYSRSEDPKDKWIFFAILIFSFGNFAYFLLKYHAHPDR